MTLAGFVADFAKAIELADARSPVAINQRSKVPFQPGLGPHAEAAMIDLVMKELSGSDDNSHQHAVGVPYATAPRQRCDLCLGVPPDWSWCIEAKLLRFLGDNGQPNDNILMHLLSPYPAHRSALSDCSKLLESGLAGRKAIMVIGFESEELPLELGMEAFEVLARSRFVLGPRFMASFDGLIHLVHRHGAVFAWELQRQS